MGVLSQMKAIDHSERIDVRVIDAKKSIETVVREPRRAMIEAIDVSRIPAEKPRPCPVCKLGAYWRSVYSLEMRCAECEPWPAEQFVRDVWFVLTLADASVSDDERFDWVESTRSRERRGAA